MIIATVVSGPGADTTPVLNHATQTRHLLFLDRRQPLPRHTPTFPVFLILCADMVATENPCKLAIFSVVCLFPLLHIKLSRETETGFTFAGDLVTFRS
jgi:hypothetical protein